jgi:hypothetical protein
MQLLEKRVAGHKCHMVEQGPIHRTHAAPNASAEYVVDLSVHLSAFITN